VRPYLEKKNHKQRASRVAQGIGPEFKPQCHKKKKKVIGEGINIWRRYHSYQKKKEYLIFEQENRRGLVKMGGERKRRSRERKWKGEYGATTVHTCI
jgi:hypothetical protein